VQVRSSLSLMLALTIIAGGAVVVGLVVSNPANLGPGGVTLWFIGLLVALQSGLTLGLYRLKGRYAETLGPKKRFTSSWRQAFLIAGVIVMLLALSSLRQLSARDAILLVILAALVEFYGRTRK
jgi:hypothetical protein